MFNQFKTFFKEQRFAIIIIMWTLTLLFSMIALFIFVSLWRYEYYPFVMENASFVRIDKLTNTIDFVDQINNM